MIRSPLFDVAIPEELSLPRYVLQEAEKYGDKVAFVDGVSGASVTFKQLVDQVRRVCSALRRRGVRKDDVILIFSPNSLAYPVILYAANYIGAVVTTCNPLYTVGELVNQLQDSKAKYVFTIPAHADKVDEAIGKYGTIKEKFVVGQHPGYTSYFKLLADDGKEFHEAPINSKEDLCLLPYSSGTTGRSKGVMLTHYNMIAMIEQITHPGVNVTVPGKEVLVCFLPFFHVYAICAYITWALRNGQTTVVLTKFDLKTYLEASEQHRATFLHMVPPVAVMLSKSPLTAKYDLKSLHSVTCGAAPFGRDQAEELMRVLDVPAVRQGYGLTETSAVTHVAPINGWKHGSVGVLLSNMECKIIDTATGAILGPNQDGEICLRGPTIMKGYLNRPDATASTIAKDGWMFTGDIGHYDEDGHFFIVDRVKELIKYNGLQVPPAELEGLLLTHPGVADAAVVGVPDAQAGELPRAYVVKKPGANVTDHDIAKHVADKVAPYKKLRGGVVFIKEIPKSASGKILRRTLKLQAAQSVKSKL